MNYRDTLNVNEKGHLQIGGVDTTELVKKFGTPLYVMDAAYIRQVAKSFADTIRDEYGEGLVAYASKAFSCLAMYKLVGALGLGTDIVSGGELYTALKAGFDVSKMFMHGNNKQAWEIDLAVKSGVGVIVLDNADEVDFISSVAAKYNKTQKVMVRVNPGVEAHTHEYIQTAKTDSKFGVSIKTGEAESIIKKVVNCNNLDFFGLHCHIGSQIFDVSAYSVTIRVLCAYIRCLADEGIKVAALNLGGGFGVTYTEEDPQYAPLDYKKYVSTLIAELKLNVAEYGIDKPYLVIEPGRAIVGEAGITLYTVGAIKVIPDVRKYVSVDGGMFDNPRFILYQSKYSAVIANKADKPFDDVVTIAGKCCESGDKIGENVKLQTPERGDILAVFTTGAYNYSMAMNYNTNAVPPVVLVDNGRADYIVKPQSLDDLIRNNAVPDWLEE